MIVFLIDADNLNSVDWIDEAFIKIEQTGQKIDVCRAYGSTANLTALTQILLKRAIYSLHNIPLSKNTTDVALAVDAMWFSLQTPMPATIFIGSGDADFVPLTARLRERGIRMVGVSGPGKMSKEVIPWYDDIIQVGKENNGNSFEDANVARQKTELTASSAKSAIASRVAKSVTVAAETVTAPVPKSALVTVNDEVVFVKRLLAEIPGWLPNTVKQLNQLGKPLREAGLKKGNSPLHNLFAKYPTFFKVLPTSGSAKQVRLLKNP